MWLSNCIRIRFVISDNQLIADECAHFWTLKLIFIDLGVFASSIWILPLFSVWGCIYVCLCMYELEVGTECILLLSTFETGSFIELGAFQTGWPSSRRGLTACVFLELGLWTHKVWLYMWVLGLRNSGSHTQMASTLPSHLVAHFLVITFPTII